ncbi:hypothetical protein NY2A_b467L [Paramecium bursaria Chlorella virus NY2A]|uniref:Uncharacterized protein b467L n=1 Tax=Paramecium bursaria Chlorella virus NY2A TaxID=46021 RepID=A7IWZ2_PBCVN|nr:hypothetical protein NY2A_b467L [Paramecium bursaria Chlorella virus NY2A]ABT14866.1 hypothetical protein NY2A_b467L [Paramecium bursaria Chlorella virus NY2A]
MRIFLDDIGIGVIVSDKQYNTLGVFEIIFDVRAEFHLRQRFFIYERIVDHDVHQFHQFLSKCKCRRCDDGRNILFECQTTHHDLCDSIFGCKTSKIVSFFYGTRSARIRSNL